MYRLVHMRAGGLLHAIIVMLFCGCRWQPPAALEGRVVDLGGGPVRARVSVEGMATSVTTDSEGHYQLPYIPGRFVVRYEAVGHLAESRQWELYDSALVPVSDTELTREPSGPGLWVPVSGRYERLEPVIPVLQEQEAIGLLSATRSTLRLDQSPRTWCLTRSLVYMSADPQEELPFVAWEVTAGGRLWTEGQSTTSRRSVKQVRIAETVWRLEATRTGAFALLNAVPDTSSMEGYYLDVQNCVGDGP